MIILIDHPVASTCIFALIFLSILFFSLRKRQAEGYLSSDVTQELKGLAILGVIFCHIGYFLVNDNRFLFPFSIFAGVSVNLFLFLSGYGLTMSQLARHLSPLEFYKKRLSKLYIPFWISLFTIFVLSFFVAHMSYSTGYVTRSFFGIFPTADLFKDINSPLWYFTFIIFYYLLFPIFFFRKYPWLSAVFLFLIPLGIILLNPPYFAGVIGLYNDHIAAFPIGILCASIISMSKIKDSVRLYEQSITLWTRRFFAAILGFCILYFMYHSSVGQGYFKEQFVSMLVVLALTFFFMCIRLRVRLLAIFGLYSYEIYLIHWPIMYHYDILYTYFSSWLATLLYLGLFVLLGFLLKKLSDKIVRYI